MPPSKIKVATFNNLGVVIDPPLKSQTVEEGYQQTLARLLGWNYLQDRFDFVNVDTDGRLLVSTEQSKSQEAQHSFVDVGVVSSVILPLFVGRKGYTIQNVSVNTVYLVLGLVATTVIGIELNAGISWSDDIYIGAISAIALVAGSKVKILEYR